MSRRIPDLTPRHIKWIEIGPVTMLELPDGWWAVRHTCERPSRGTIICAPELTRGGHRIIQLDPLTVEPSILCLDCGLHGWVRSGAWVAA